MQVASETLKKGGGRVLWRIIWNILCSMTSKPNEIIKYLVSQSNCPENHFSLMHEADCKINSVDPSNSSSTLWLRGPF